MKPKLSNERGQALILITLAAIGLFAIAGLAIDGSAKYADRRHAQNAADAAAMAGALELARNETPNPDVWNIVAQNVAIENGFDDDHLRSDVWVYQCSDDRLDPISLRYNTPVETCGAYEGRSDYIQVVILSYVDTYFARVIGINRTTNAVQAVTRWQPDGEFYDGHLIVALNPDPCSGGGADGNVTLGTAGGGGSEAVINLDGGGIHVNSDGSGCGMNLVGCPTISIDGNLGSSGSGNINLENSSATCTDKLDMPAPSFNQDQYDFPPRMPPEPDECVAPNGTWSNDDTFTAISPSGDPYTGLTILQPGRYNEFPPKSGGGFTVHDHVFMVPGIYCVNDTIKTVDNKLWLEGDNVTIYIRPGYKFSYEGGTIELSATTDPGPYKGFVIIVASDFTGTPENCKIDGNSYNSFTGTIFAPYCNLTINGGSAATSYNAQIIAYTVKLVGSASIDLYYDKNKTAHEDPEVGLRH